MPRGDGTGPMKGKGAGCGRGASLGAPAGSAGMGAEERDRLWRLFARSAAQKHRATTASPAMSRNARNAKHYGKGVEKGKRNEDSSGERKRRDGENDSSGNLAFFLASAGRRVQYLDCDVEEPNGIFSSSRQ